VAIDRRAVAIAEKTFGLGHQVLGEALVDLGVHLGHARHHDEAYDQIRRGEAILAKANGPDDPRFLLSLVQRGNLLSGQARWRDALALYQQAIPPLERAHFTRREITSAVIHQERGFLALHQPTRGLAALEQLAANLGELRPDLRVAVEFTLARALWDSGGDWRRAHELASHALEDIGDLARTHGDDIAQIERALASHRPGNASSPRPSPHALPRSPHHSNPRPPVSTPTRPSERRNCSGLRSSGSAWPSNGSRPGATGMDMSDLPP
jgi:tetratricopeptide (TPR) repeat protein